MYNYFFNLAKFSYSLIIFSNYDAVTGECFSLPGGGSNDPPCPCLWAPMCDSNYGHELQVKRSTNFICLPMKMCFVRRHCACIKTITYSFNHT